MTIGTLRVAARRIAEHAAAHRLPGVVVVLHGGEPLLVGEETLRGMLHELRAAIDPVTRLDVRMQSNGVRLSDGICRLLTDFDVKVGISLDGDRAANDRHRRFASGTSSHPHVVRALELLRRPEFRRQYTGILCTVDLRNDPIAVYEALRAQVPPRVDLLLPHATWENPPPRDSPGPWPYARWLLAIYDRWTADGRPMPIRIFDSIRSTAVGGLSGTEAMGLDPADLAVVEVDGSWEQVDSLKAAFEGAPRTGLTVFADSVDAVASLPDIDRRRHGLAGLAAACQVCPVVQQCGGGLFTHRYQRSTGFDNPSVYCTDLKALIVSINSRLSVRSGRSTGGTGVPGAVDWPVSDDLIRSVGSGQPDEAAVAYLVAHQFWRAQNLVTELGFRSSSEHAAIDGLRQLDREAPDAVGTVLLHPYLRPWVMAQSPDAGSGPSPLSSLVLAAAIRGHRPISITTAILDGEIHLPTVGTVLAGAGASSAEVSLSGRELVIRLPSATVVLDPYERSDTAVWRPTRWLPFGDSWLVLEDQHPARDCHDWPAQTRRAPAEAAAWQATLAQAHRAIAIDLPDQLPALRRALRAIVPLQPDLNGRLRSSTSYRAFGSAGVAYTPDAAALAVLLVHEFQHTILSALLDLVELVRPDATERLRVGWRDDPRPLLGVLYGAHAHFVVADVWRHRAARESSGDRLAADTYHNYRLWTADAIVALLASGGLTAAGRLLVESMAVTLESWPL